MFASQMNSSLIALVGSPNSGKTTLFNWLTGSKFKTVNYPGSTVECSQGNSLPVYGEVVKVVDTPGVYSLHPQAADEEVTFEVLSGQKKFGKITAVVAVIDATQMERQLYVVRQLQAAGFITIVALTMSDLAANAGMAIDLVALSKILSAPVVAINGRLGGGVLQLMETVRGVLAQPRSSLVGTIAQWETQRIEEEMTTVSRWAKEVTTSSSVTLQQLNRLRRFDHILLHPVFGLIVFAFVMMLLFSSIFWMARPIMDIVDYVFSFLASRSTVALGGGAFGDFVGNGLVAGAGSVLIFVPQIFILFFGLNLLEDSGYLARAATIIDRPFQKVGLSGRSFVPLLSGFACAVPGIMAVRNLRSKREKWIATFVLPLMTCSARLPVYALLLYFLFRGQAAWKPGLSLASLYLLSVALGAIAAMILNRMLKAEKSAPFMLELPFYRKPNFRVVFKTSLKKTKSYVLKAGPTIFGFVLLLWLGTHFPNSNPATEAERLQNSLVGQIGQTIEPVFRPMGADWRVGVSLLSAFVAREVFVSSLAVILNVTTEKEGIQDSLLAHMRESRLPDGRALFTPASVAALIVFFMIALQCLSTTSVVWREMQSKTFAVSQVVILNTVAYLLAVMTYQTLAAWGWG
jgi:ferrous iron transport protein B